MSGGQNLERPNVEQPIIRNFEISNIKITKVELFVVFLISKFIFLFLRLFKLFEHSKYTYDNLPNWKFSKF